MDQQHRTPTSVSCRQRHTPTPKMSERKKKLFGGGGLIGGNSSGGGLRTSNRLKNNLSGLPQTILEGDDNDGDDDDDDNDGLGPMSPLQFSSSPKSYDKYEFIEIVPCTPIKKHEIRTDFKNILKLSPLQNKQSKGSTINHQSLIKNKAETSITKKITTINADIGQSSSLSSSSPPPSPQFSSNKENYTTKIIDTTENVLLKTPNSCETSTSITSTNIPRISFRKSLIFDTGITPDAPHLSPTTKKFLQKQTARLNLDSQSPIKKLSTTSSTSLFNNNDSTTVNSKAKTSLSFSTESIISPKSFYGSSLNQYDPFKNHRKSLPVTVPQQSKSKIPKKKTTPTRILKRHTIGHGGPVLGGGFRGRGHKIQKPKFLQLKTNNIGTQQQQTTTTKQPMSKNQILQAAIQVIEQKTNGLCTPSIRRLTSSQEQTNNLHDQSDDNAITREQIARLQNILKSHTFFQPIDKCSRSINWSSIGKTITTKPTHHRDELNQSTSSSIDAADTSIYDGHSFSSLDTSQQNKTNDGKEDDDDNNDDENDEQLSKRKFFKSRKSESSIKQYKVMKGVCATVKRGASIKLLSPKRKKQKKHEYDEYQSIQNEVNDIISMLNIPNTPTPQLSLQKQQQQQQQVTIKPAAVAPPPTTTTTATITSSNLTKPIIISQINEPERFRQMLPYKTNDPETYKRQQTLLDLLISNDICTEENFKIFIAEPNQHIEQANNILDALIVVDISPYLDDIDDVSFEEYSNTNIATGFMENIPMITNDTTAGTTTTTTMTVVENMIDDYPMSPASQISTMTSGLALESPPIHRNYYTNQQQTPLSSPPPLQQQKMINPGSGNKNEKPFFPIFIHKRRQTTDSSNFETNKFIESTNNYAEFSKLQKWKQIGIGGDKKQLQIDAGQKKFGAHMCKECGMFYSQHEPEDELIHQKYHLSRSKLTFKGWQNERIVCQVPEWDVTGRILIITTTDTKKHQQYAEEILKMIDEDLGIVTAAVAAPNSENQSIIHGLKPSSTIYLAIAKQQVIGVCVAEIKKLSYPVVQNWGALCMKTDQIVPVKCGISRIWVTPTYRRCGIARKLIDTVCNTFIFGYKLNKTDLAYSSPTNDGYELAKSLLPSDQPVLVYDELD